MPLNPFFLQGSKNEQFLVQDLINEQLKIYGIEVFYLPRKIFKTDSIIREVQSSKFDDSFAIEAYLNNYEGYNPNSELMTKFGLRLTNEVSLTISKERFEETITPFLEGISSGIKDGLITDYTFEDLINRPKEGDLIYFPLGERLFEIKRVESEKPFYQLGKNYTYELSCELYEYENELIETTLEEVDNTVEDQGYITMVNLVGTAVTATGVAGVGGTGMIGFIDIIQDGSGYVTAPSVEISPSPYGVRAEAIAITTSKGGSKSIKEIRLTNPGSGYDPENPPLIIINGGGGAGVAITFGIVSNGISTIIVNNRGRGYSVEPDITFTGANGGTAAAAKVVLNDDTGVESVQFLNTGLYPVGIYTAPTVEFSGISTTGVGTYLYNEVVTGSLSGTTARVRNFKKRVDIDNVHPPIELQVSLNSGKFSAGEVIVGSISSARYVVDSYTDDSFEEPFDSNKEIESEADSLLDFTEGNPFGDY